VVVEGAPTGWWDGVPGVLGAHAVDDAAVLVELTDDADDQALLDAARSAGRVRHFAAAEVRLADLFREVVAA
jgi:ABC-2 type transport system ATP-binding protein